MANPVAIVTDSTAYIPKDWVEKYNIKVTPSVVIWDGEELRDGLDITADAFFKRLANSPTMPTTSQPTPAYFKNIYENLLAEGKDILGIHISHKLSGTFASAEQAKALFPDAKIANVDTLSAAMGEGWPLLMAVCAARAGKSLGECRAIVEEACKHTGILLTVDTLEFLHRGGRIGGASRLIGTMLNFKPILQILDGRIEPRERVRTRKKSLNRLVELAVEEIGDKRPVYMATIHANALDEAELVMEMLGEKLPLSSKITTSVSAAVGTHTGPGTIGIVWMAGYDYKPD